MQKSVSELTNGARNLPPTSSGTAMHATAPANAALTGASVPKQRMALAKRDSSALLRLHAA